jgi:PHD/YefM family antitoxin component YafN of YafNO toxin-antitoxin module
MTMAKLNISQCDVNGVEGIGVWLATDYEACGCLARLIDEVVDRGCAALVQREGDPGEDRVAYVVPATLWESLTETLYLVSGPNGEHIRESIRQSRAGNVAERRLIE